MRQSEDLLFWQTIKAILDSHDFPDYESGKLTNFLSDKCDYNKIMSKAKPLNLSIFHFRDCIKNEDGNIGEYI